MAPGIPFGAVSGPEIFVHSPPPFWRRPQADVEIHFMEEYKRDLEQELNEVNDRLKNLKNQG
ncbi:MAG: DUF5320 domain-containing protein [Dehalococcoidia bacterium]|nr:DUF5320 domain-containing protein [Dehalococcoidia bacterium]